MTHQTENPYARDEYVEEADDEQEPRRGLLSWILIVTMLMGTGSASAVVWRSFGGGTLMPSSLASISTTTTGAAPAEKAAGQGDLAALRQEVTGSVQSTQQLVAAQQTEIRRLSEQVSALSSKLELIQRPVNSAQAAMPAPIPGPVAAPPALRPAAPLAPKTAAAPKKKPEAPKPVSAEPRPTNGGPISTGGAPLQLSR